MLLVVGAGYLLTALAFWHLSGVRTRRFPSLSDTAQELTARAG